MITRRNLLLSGAATVAGSALLSRTPALLAAAPATSAPQSPSTTDAQGDYLPVTIPNGARLPWKMVDGVKVFHLVAEEVDHEFAPGLRAACWGYNGSVHGPLIEAVDGDRVRIYVTNRLPAPTTVHWHSILLPNGMDGVGGLNQPAIPPGETFRYEFTLRQVGTAMYHAHHDEMTQIGLGMTGMFIIHPHPGKNYGDLRQPPVDRDFAIMLHEWRIDPGASRPNPLEMIEFNVLTMNAKVFPATEPLVVKTGQRVRIRLANLSPMEHHPIHLHGYHFTLAETDGGRIPPAAQHTYATILVPVGSTRTIEFTADAPGDWAFHCHMTHHVMNQMGHQAANMIGVDTAAMNARIQPLLPGYMAMGQSGMAHMGEMHMPAPHNSIPMVGGPGKYDYITMGGMFTVLKFRDTLPSFADPGWYDAPPATVASPASRDQLQHDGIQPPPQARSPSIAPSSAPAILYTCAMHPQILSEKPGLCPICGMTLIPRQ
jgi:FtsP/CotA-like multicopper oxidase with cupredoxin domain